MAKPRLDCFKISLNHKDKQFSTFKDFMIEKGVCSTNDTDATIFGKLYEYFMNAPTKDFATDDKAKKCIRVVPETSINIHYEERPKPISSDNVICGVINGGKFGSSRILSDLSDKDKVNTIKTNQPVLQYFYIYLYLPLDYYEGILMIHSNGKEDSITNFAKEYIKKLFTCSPYKKPRIDYFAPQKYQDEYLRKAMITSMVFKKTCVNTQIEEDKPLYEFFSNYDVSIEVRPKNKNIILDTAKAISRQFKKFGFGREDDKYTMDESDGCYVHTSNKDTRSNKTFEISMLENEFVPTIYLDEDLLQDDGTPNFKKLAAYADKVFKETIYPEIRPDKNVKRMD